MYTLGDTVMYNPYFPVLFSESSQAFQFSEAARLVSRWTFQLTWSLYVCLLWVRVDQWDKQIEGFEPKQKRVNDLKMIRGECFELEVVRQVGSVPDLGGVRVAIGTRDVTAEGLSLRVGACRRGLALCERRRALLELAMELKMVWRDIVLCT
ncbi:hypothetical protein GOODEAATRI_025537 [Goodea atripinnis]|uniref:Uncharacterized protein n=1 Tax=Goodea atripinnis TaxID=208336 RepID=A0ABV0N484_9TELE